MTSFQITSVKQGTFQVGFSDPTGLALSSLTNPTNYTLARRLANSKQGPTLPVATVVTANLAGQSPVDAALVTGKFNLKGRRLFAQNGTYVLTVHSTGITSESGVALDGEYAGQFPTGDGQAGGDFKITVKVRNGKASAAMVSTKAVAATHTVKIKALGKHHHA